MACTCYRLVSILYKNSVNIIIICAACNLRDLSVHQKTYKVRKSASLKSFGWSIHVVVADLSLYSCSKSNCVGCTWRATRSKCHVAAQTAADNKTDDVYVVLTSLCVVIAWTLRGPGSRYRIWQSILNFHFRLLPCRWFQSTDDFSQHPGNGIRSI